MTPTRILFAGLFHETHSFLGVPTRWEDFAVSRGEEILAKRGDESPIDGFLEVAEACHWQVIPTIDAHAVPSGVVNAEVFERFWQEFSDRALPALAAGVEAIFLVLHGAMVTTALEDAEGEFIERIRQLPGAAHLPIFGVLDLHGNITARMCGHATGFVAYRHNPHTDAKAATVRAARLLARCLHERTTPRMVWSRIPIIWAPPGTGTATDPMRALTAFAEKMENTDPSIWAYNVFGGFSFADTAQTGVTLSAIVTQPDRSADDYLRTGAELAWSLREHGEARYPSIDTLITQLPPASGQPIILVEPADNIGAGAPGDGTGILRALLAHNIGPALVAINDPATVQHLASFMPGDVVPVEIGGRSWPLDLGPVKCEVTLLSQQSGLFTLEDPHSHLASLCGLHFDMGPCAVVRHRNVTLLLTSARTPPFDLGQFRSQGIEPSQFAVIGVKAAVAHRRAYDPITGASFWVDTPGPCSSDVAAFPYRRLQRPVYPLDPISHPHLLFS
jgi:microcystin degradation protein MlrC